MTRASRTVRLLLAVCAAGLALLVVAPAAQAQPGYEGGTTLTVSDPSPGCGSSVTLTGTGFKPNAEVTLTEQGGGVVGTATTDASGSFSFVWVIPQPCTAGTVVITASDGTTVMGVSITIGAGSGGTSAPATLPRTGSDSANLLRAGVLLIAAGGLLVLATRKRAAAKVSVDS
ncbi:MAG: carboxypeptidase-like regulatory domain-containing protein [Acidimicrobiales bacterium]